jgi:hypothetical protein
LTPAAIVAEAEIERFQTSLSILPNNRQTVFGREVEVERPNKSQTLFRKAVAHVGVEAAIEVEFL